MKTKLFLFSLSFFLSVVFSPKLMATDLPSNSDNTLTKQEMETKISNLTEQISVLKIAKKQALTRAEKQQIKHEIRDIKKEARALKQQAGSGIYIGGGVLLVALLLILLL